MLIVFVLLCSIFLVSPAVAGTVTRAIQWDNQLESIVLHRTPSVAFAFDATRRQIVTIYPSSGEVRLFMGDPTVPEDRCDLFQYPLDTDVQLEMHVANVSFSSSVRLYVDYLDRLWVVDRFCDRLLRFDFSVLKSVELIPEIEDIVVDPRGDLRYIALTHSVYAYAQLPSTFRELRAGDGQKQPHCVHGNGRTSCSLFPITSVAMDKTGTLYILVASGFNDIQIFRLAPGGLSLELLTLDTQPVTYTFSPSTWVVRSVPNSRDLVVSADIGAGGSTNCKGLIYYSRDYENGALAYKSTLVLDMSPIMCTFMRRSVAATDESGTTSETVPQTIFAGNRVITFTPVNGVPYLGMPCFLDTQCPDNVQCVDLTCGQPFQPPALDCSNCYR